MQDISKYKIVALDTNIFIYYLNANSQFYSVSASIIEKIVQGNLRAVTSILTLIELLSFDIPKDAVKKLEQEFSDMPNITLKEVSLNIAKIAARLRREQGIKLADSIQLATALDTNAQAFITNDSRLKKFKELSVFLLKDI